MPVPLGNVLLLMLGTGFCREGSATPITTQQGSQCGQKPQGTSPLNFYSYLSRIVGGNEVQQGSHPWQVSLKRNHYHFCGGTLVSSQWVITAAHCVVSSDLLESLTITAGEHNLDLMEAEEQTLRVKSIIRHPKFDPRHPVNYDIAVLKMDGHFKYGNMMVCYDLWENATSSTVFPVCLPDPGEKFDPGFICTTCGWGRLRENVKMKSSVASCSSQDGQLPDKEGRLDFPDTPKHFYQHNQFCIWTLSVPEKMHILLNFSHFDVEPETFCDFDSLSVISMDNRLIGKFCGMDPPLPILVGSNSVRLKFISDNKEHGTGFSMLYQAVAPATLPDSGCGSLAIFFEEGTVQSMHYPEPYSNLADCQWIVHAPEDHVVKLTYEYFELEENEDCTYDSVAVYENVAEEKEIARSCGFAIPAPVLSSSSTMLIRFHSDETETFGGFKAKFLFINVADLNISNSSSEVTLSEEANGSTNETDIPDDVCGVASNPPRFLFSRIIGGEEAVPHSWPWQASMQIAGENFCGGAVLTKTWVVTAAHCFLQREQYRDVWSVVVGVHDIKAQEQNSQKRLVTRYFMHPAFNSTTMDSDIAVVQLSKPLDFNHYVRPVCLPESEDKMEPSRACVITGWGIHNEDRERSRKLQQLEVPILVSEECQKYYQNHSGGVSKRMFCAGFPAEEDKDSCTGDSGGPLVCPSDDSGYYILNGIISWGTGCGRKDYPGVYTNVASFVDWIGQHIDGTTNSSATFYRFLKQGMKIFSELNIEGTSKVEALVLDL
ncbi:hypothetical protein lerEdw1_005341 [Lerista edwardsae]|nr:hypothetical protein lerEdw1_005341 [Lerista edwardsae]